MAIARDAGPIEVALDAIASLTGRPRLGTIDDAYTCLAAASLWRQVYEGARDRGDDVVAAIAAKERAHALATYRRLVDGDDPPPP